MEGIMGPNSLMVVYVQSCIGHQVTGSDTFAVSQLVMRRLVSSLESGTPIGLKAWNHRNPSTDGSHKLWNHCAVRLRTISRRSRHIYIYGTVGNRGSRKNFGLFHPYVSSFLFLSPCSRSTLQGTINLSKAAVLHCQILLSYSSTVLI